MRVMSIEEAQTNFCEVANLVATTSEPVIVERQGRPVTVLISPEDYEQLRRQRREQMWLAIDRIREANAGKNPDEEYAFITQVVEEVRQELYEEEQGGAGGRR